MSFFGVPNTDLVVEDNGESVYRIRNGKQHFYKIQTSRAGYRMISTKIHGKRRTLLIHRLVALACLPLIDGKAEVNHKDGNKANNLYTNLEWVTKSENIKHAIKSGLLKAVVGKDNTERDKEIKEAFSAGKKTIPELAEIYGLKIGRMRQIVYGTKINTKYVRKSNR